ncbi:helix-turn-helix domain-containing protein [Kitasatospora sp. NPDC056651]|uniref:helix-turn-helix domain-containing protein n=1 Tax=Kitasatospora sp. NPDC056651 TaxID=3345892 RepID=UPI0036870218
MSLLQAARLSRGWSLRQAADELAQLGHRVTVQQLSAWEQSTTRPSVERLDALCRLHQTRPDRLGYGTDYTPMENQAAPEYTTPNTNTEVPMDPVQAGALTTRHAILRGLLSQVGLSLSAPVLSALMSARQDGVAVFTTNVADTTVDQWESTAAEYGHAYQHTPPARLLGDAVLDFLDVRQLLSHRQSADHRARLCHVAARLAATAGIALDE